jgi:N-acetylmuramic acid 6-phosphate etherase
MASDVTDVLGIEGGGTKTTWARVARDGSIRAQGEAGPGNTLLLDDAALGDLFRGIAGAAGTDVAAIGGAFAGCAQPREQKRVEKFLREVWPKAATVRVMEDTRSILAAAFGDGPGIVVIAGTGSNVAGQKSLATPIEKAGGWGHLFADRGSAYDVARRGMEAVFALWDEERKIDVLGREFLAAAKLESLEELVPFLLRDTSKTTVAGYAPCVFTAAQHGDRTACALLDEAAGELAQRVSAVAKRLGVRPVRVVLAGGLFENQAEYRARFHKALKRVMPGAQVNLADVPGVLGAARVAMGEAGGIPAAAAASAARRSAATGKARSGASQDRERSQTEFGNEGKARGGSADVATSTSTVARRSTAATEGSMGVGALKPIAEPARLAAFSAASTEQRNPRSRGLDKRTIPQLVDLFIREERYVDRALFAQRGAIARAAALVAKKLQAGGRLIYIGAGTSGRLGVIDASEMPPTFNAPPEQVQAIMAGGAAAVFKSQEGAEDARDTAVAELRARKLAKNDVVCGIAASGQTPFVLAALEEARRVGAGAILVSCNPKRRIKTPVDVAIDLPTGPEIVTGSTRLKAGTATKLVLNMLSTIAMVRLGRVSDNLMTNVQATNDKLRARCVRLVEALAKVDAVRAQEVLEGNGWRVLEALEVLGKARGRKRG